MPLDPKLLFSVRREEHVTGRYLKPFYFRCPLIAVRRPIPDPVEDGYVIVGTDLEALSAGMGHQGGGLQQQQAFFGLFQVDSRIYGSLRLCAEHLITAALHDPVIIFVRNQSVVREFESTPSLDASMAVAVIASALREDLFDAGLEVGGFWGLGCRSERCEPEHCYESGPGSFQKLSISA